MLPIGHPRDEKARIRKELRLHDLCAHLGLPVKRAGNTHFFRCPVHGSEGVMQSCHFQPHAAVDGADLWKCEKCGASGDVFTLIMLVQQVSFPQAIHIAQEFLGKVPARPQIVVTTPTKKAESVSLAPPSLRDAVYCALLSLPQYHLGDAQKAGLLARGFTEADIQRLGYAQSRRTNGIWIAKRISSFTGITDFTGVPGFYRTPHGCWAVKSMNGLLIPVRSVHGKIYAIRVRVPTANGGRVYVWMSSLTDKEGKPRPGGSSPGALLHTAAVPGSQRLWVTEGELKADRASLALQETVVSVPGVGNWAHIPELAAYLRVREVVVAYDRDAGRTETLVAKHRDNMIAALKAQGTPVSIAVWDRKLGKGLDDVLHSHGNGAIQRQPI
ncbi:DUF3854 domain-containing protein [Heliobacterium undosum]|uniref:DUF3854 domain-containing protein n=1 Tax=Heliomicrobium undosum TaxID=121734 RepID=A0A845L442_9FIRM|nr:DUF3854 domain-containing protein [Heliomicrobium undosum]MZP31412.1 DUF3854 domain-containing protein [Heliomicrobium undosum]